MQHQSRGHRQWPLKHRELNDQDGVDEGNKGSGQGTGEVGDQTEADGGSDANTSEDPERSNDQEDAREGLSWKE